MKSLDIQEAISQRSLELKSTPGKVIYVSSEKGAKYFKNSE